MIALFLILSFVRTLQGAPLLAASSLDIDTLPRDSSTDGCNNSTTRTTYQLVRSCLLTIFACVWKSVHPNISGPRDPGWTRMKRRLTITICALIAPELMTMWALRQYLAAKEIAEDYNKIAAVKNANPQADAHSSSLWDSVKDWFSPELPVEYATRRIGQRWTTTHGFFVQMGGFLLYENDKATKVLKYQDMKEMIEEGKIDAPIYTETDLQDRSKGDVVSKGLVAFQTTWFVVQCITRLCKHLPLSELEVVTLGFAVLNGIIYGIWWKKPQGVETAIFIPLKRTESRPTGDADSALEDSQGMPEGPRTLQGSVSAIADPDDRQETEDVKRPRDTGSLQLRENTLENEEFSDIKRSHLRRMLEGPTSEAFERLRVVRSKLKWWQWWLLLVTVTVVFVVPLTTTVFAAISLFVVPVALGSLLRPLIKMAYRTISIQTDGTTAPLRRRLPMFYADERGDGRSARYATCGIGVLFGLVHIFGWWSESLSPKQLHLWHASTLTTIVSPLVLAVAIPLTLDRDGQFTAGRSFAFAFPSMIIAIAYLAARFTLITLAFIALHIHTPKVFDTVSWTTFIPHV